VNRNPAAVPALRTTVRRRRRLSWLQALALVAAVTGTVVVTGGGLLTRTDPDRFPNLATGLWWAVSTVTTVGYGDVVPTSTAGRLVAAAIMFVGIGSFAFLTAVAASAIVVGEVGEEESRIEREEHEIERTQRVVLARLADIDERLARLDRPRSRGGPGRTARPTSRRSGRFGTGGGPPDGVR
jgi:voltage-gated potassium channel